VMLSNGWIEEIASDEDGRGLPIQATQRGNTLLEDVSPAWNRAQQKAERLLGADGASHLRKLSSELLGKASGGE